MTKRIPLHSVSEFIDYGLTTSATDANTGVKFLRITDIQDDVVHWENVPYCHCSKEDAKQYELSEGDILFARTGATTGKSYLIRVRVQDIAKLFKCQEYLVKGPTHR
jgi:type I restriction enzyme S subunit